MKKGEKMSAQAIISTITGGFLFTFLIQILWGRLVNKFGSFGGILAAVLISGTMWVLNHGLTKPLIFQSGSLWIDMAWAPAVSGIVYSLLAGKKIKKSVPNIIAAILGGIMAGLLISSL